MKANAVNSIKNLLSNKLANTNFASPTQNHIITDSLAEILAQELPNPSKISFYNPHQWVIDSAHGGRDHLHYHGYHLPGIRR